MHEALDQIRTALRVAGEAIARHDELARTPKQRADDLAEARNAHRHAVGILAALHSQARHDHALVEAIAPLQLELADLEVLLTEIRFDEREATERMPRVHQADLQRSG